MAGKIWEFFGYRSDDHSPAAVAAATDKQCPYLSEVCEKRLSDGAIAGVCTIKPATSGPVICCPIRLYADKYRALYDVAKIAFDDDLELIAGRQADVLTLCKIFGWSNTSQALTYYNPTASDIIDESSILKSLDGKFKTRIIERFAKTPYRLSCSATPSPNA